LLINHFSDDGSALINENQVKLRREGKLIYALIDFDVSLMAPPDIKREDYRLPYGESFIGSGNQPYDTSQGEFDYDPFAYDVGSTGVEFCNHFQVRNPAASIRILFHSSTWISNTRGISICWRLYLIK
jgi:hypothetical protein